MSKLFRGGALSDTALLAREAIQNSSDAHERFKKAHPEVAFRVVFRFVHLFGDEKSAAVEALDLRGMQERRSKYPADPLQPGSALDTLDDPRVPLQLLYVEDYGTHGLFGDPATGKKSHLFMAMYYIGASTKGADEGGLYGFGKSALQRASRTRTVVVHTAFKQQGKDPVRSRLLGFTWWPDLQDDDTLYDGRGSFSDHHAAGPGQQDMPTPFVDLNADQLAEELGFQARDVENPADLGSSFLVVDPAITPEDLLAEVEKWWWPALEEHSLDVQVVLPVTGDVKVPKPAANSFVSQFLRAYRIATGVDEASDPNRERLASKDWRNRSGAGGQDLGALALVVPDAAIDTDGEETDTASLVALMRGPRMIVDYPAFGKRRVPLRGVFVASDKANSLLRETEPSTHDRWTTNPSADVPKEATEVAQAVKSKIQNSVTKMAKDIAPPPPKTNRALGHFSKLMNGFLGNKRGKPTPPTAGGERIELTFPDGRPFPEVLDDTDVRVKTKFTVRVADEAEKSACPVAVTCQLYIFEDDAQSQSRWPVSIKPITRGHGLNLEDDGSWTGVLTKDKKITFEAESEPYPNLWTISLQPSVARTGDWSDQ